MPKVTTNIHVPRTREALVAIVWFCLSMTTLHAQTVASFYATLIESFEKSSWRLYENEVFPSYETYKQRFDPYHDENTTRYEALRQKVYRSWQNIAQQLESNASMQIMSTHETLTCPTKDVRTRRYKHTLQLKTNKNYFAIEVDDCLFDDGIRCFGVPTVLLKPSR
ncbi:MAG: hypothetical protein KU28_07015 [Sulfurovum sp. PC08-66]|nr:MAG: hypothetical protein KU28_07015 [Sulfurovum sp. PC08-66]